MSKRNKETNWYINRSRKIEIEIEIKKSGERERKK